MGQIGTYKRKISINFLLPITPDSLANGTALLLPYLSDKIKGNKLIMVSCKAINKKMFRELRINWLYISYL